MGKTLRQQSIVKNRVIRGLNEADKLFVFYGDTVLLVLCNHI